MPKNNKRIIIEQERIMLVAHVLQNKKISNRIRSDKMKRTKQVVEEFSLMRLETEESSKTPIFE